MKKIKSLLLFSIIMMFISVVDVNAAGVSIKSIKSVDTKGDVVEKSEPKVNGLNINFNLAFSAKDDSITYEVVLKNPTNVEYEINTEKKFGPSNYISYSYELKDKTNRIKANSEVTLNITIKYENQVPVDKLVNGKYEESNDMGINLLNEDNPNTFNNILLLLLILILLVGLTLIMIKTKHNNIAIFIIMLLLVPVSVFAVEKLQLKVSTKITVERKYNVFIQTSKYIETSKLNDNNYLSHNCVNDIKLEQEDGSYVDYSDCSYIYKRDSKSYLAGDRVVISSPTYKTINLTQCSENTNEHKLICPKDSLFSESIVCFNYHCINGTVSRRETKAAPEYNPFYNQCSEEEFNSMNFTNTILSPYFDVEFDTGDVDFKDNGGFIMPDHDVYIGLGCGK